MSKVNKISRRDPDVNKNPLVSMRNSLDDINLTHSFKDANLLRVRSVNVSHDNRYLVFSCENTSTLRILDLSTLTYLPFDFRGHLSSIRRTSISRDGLVYTASYDGTIRCFNMHNGQCTKVLSGGMGRCPGVFLMKDEIHLLSGSYDGDLALDVVNQGRMWNLENDTVIHVFPQDKKNHRFGAEAIGVKADSDGFIYISNDTGSLKKYAPNGEFMKTLIQTNTMIRGIDTGRQLISAACCDGYIRITDKNGNYEKKIFTKQRVEVDDVHFNEDETKIWAALDDGSVSCYDLASGNLIYNETFHPTYIWNFCVYQQNTMIVTSGSDGKICFVSANSGELLATLYALNNFDVLISCPPDKVFPSGVFYASNPEYVKVYDKIKGKTLVINDPQRLGYLADNNLKNLVQTRIARNQDYQLLLDNYTKFKDSKNHLNDINNSGLKALKE